jgi:hypothetical protein
MIIGHLGVALGARRFARSAPIGWLLAATFAPDVWRVVLADSKYGWWHANMYSHALPWSAIIAVVLASTAWLVLRDGVAAMIVLVIVGSHVGLDLISGWKPLWIGGPHGLDLQHVEQAELLLESAIAWIGWRLARRDRLPRWMASPAFVIALVAIQSAYGISYFRARPAETRCVMYPFAPCWTKL